MGTTPAPITVSPHADDGQTMALGATASLNPAGVVVRQRLVIEPAAPTSAHLFVVLHQFLV
jgi:hypothetical protein